MASIIILIAGVVCLLISSWRLFRRTYKVAIGFKAKMKTIWEFSGVILGTAIIAASIFF